MNMFNRPFNQFRIHQSCSLPFNNLKQVHDHRSGVHSPRYFHTTHSVNNYLHWIHSLFQMSWPSIACCYVEIIEDQNLLHWFSQEEYSSTQNSHVWVLSNSDWYWEGFFTCIASPSKWGKTGVEFVTLTCPKKSGEITNMVILITDGVGESDLGMVIVFCHPDQARIEACDALSALHQCNSSELSVVVIRRYSNTPYIPRGCPMYFIWMWALSPGALLLPNFP